MDFRENGRIIFLKDFTIFTIFFVMFMFRENAYHTMYNTSKKERDSESNRGCELATLAGNKRESRDRTHKSPNLKAQSITRYSKKYMETTTGFTDTPERKYAEEACKVGKGEKLFGAIKPFISPGTVPLAIENELKRIIPEDIKQPDGALHTVGSPQKR